MSRPVDRDKEIENLLKLLELKSKTSLQAQKKNLVNLAKYIKEVLNGNFDNILSLEGSLKMQESEIVRLLYIVENLRFHVDLKRMINKNKKR